jgi:hypothetical protein
VAPAWTSETVVRVAARVVGWASLTVGLVLVAPVVGVLLALLLAQCAGVH